MNGLGKGGLIALSGLEPGGVHAPNRHSGLGWHLIHKWHFFEEKMHPITFPKKSMGERVICTGTRSSAENPQKLVAL